MDELGGVEGSAIRGGRRKLYEREAGNEETVNDLAKRDYEVGEQWLSDEEQEVARLAQEGADVNAQEVVKELRTHKKRHSIFKTILIVSLVFFIASLGFAFYRFYTEENTLRVEFVNFDITGPVAVGSGEVTRLQVVLSNDNPASVEGAILDIQLPVGVTANLEGRTYRNRITRELGTLRPGEVVNERLDVVFTGQQNEQKEVTALLDFRFEGSNQILQRRAEYSVLLTSSPVSLEVTLLDEALPEQEIEMTLVISSDSDEVMEGLVLDVDYPPGFTFIGSNLPPTYGSSIWELEALAPFGKRMYVIRGLIEGLENEEEVFQYQVGTSLAENPGIIDTVLDRVTEEVLIKQPFIGLQIVLGGQTGAPFAVFSEEETVSGSVRWVNNTSKTIIDGQIEVTLDERASRAPGSIQASEGFYRSLNDVLLWNQQTMPALAVIDPGESGVVRFSFRLLPIREGDLLDENVEFEVNAVARGIRNSETGVPETIDMPAVSYGRIATKADLLSRALYYDGPLTNGGPLPPRPNLQTTYTVEWQITNGANALDDVSVRSSLPAHAQWIGLVSPTTEDVTYNELTNTIEWKVPRVEAGAGVTRPVKEVAFQVGIIPSTSQIGKTIRITGGASLEAVDAFTSRPVLLDSDPLTTDLLNDPYFDYNEEGRVAP